MKRKRNKPSDLADVLRRAVAASGLSLYAVAKRAALRVSLVQRFMHKPGAQLYTDSAERIAAALGCRIVLQPMEQSR